MLRLIRTQIHKRTAILLATTLTLLGGCAEGPQTSAGASEGKAAWVQSFAEIAAKPGVTTTDSGLMFEVLKNGSGPTPPSPIRWSPTTTARCSTAPSSTPPTNAASRRPFR